MVCLVARLTADRLITLVLDGAEMLHERESMADNLARRFGITQREKAEPDHTVCSIGFSPSKSKWYGWSHRAVYGFGVGDPDYSEDLEATPKKDRPKIKSLAHAKEAAKRFARSVA